MQVGTTPIRFDISRILAFSTAIALHALALALLLIPLSQVPVRNDAIRPEPRWAMPEIVPITPPPVPVPTPITPTLPSPRPLALPPALQSAPLPVFTAEAVISTDPATIAATAATSTAVPASPGVPLEGVSLHYLVAPAPAYPREALRSGAQGTVVLRVRVDERGLPVEVAIERSSGHRSLDNAARSQVARYWKFHPALDHGRPVQAYGLIPIDFHVQ
ncbi:energy transducer TonB [Stenotrophomonas sp. YIM B06876]|uniref:energy transducer TonB n=1 Tax=Stenotrophomonas sp. YIM B06876 TaxID=3060211 RepID=UPI0027398588|nr:energy transducer TonB [Stenotrophomonas sp. YIM B06876]